MNIVLWIFQILLALLFLFAGISKLFTPMEVPAAQMGLSVNFLKFIGVLEALGGIGLIVPSLTRIKPSLTPLSAAGLVIIMIGAIVISVRAVSALAGILPLVTLVLLVFVAYGRTSLFPIRPR